MEGMFRNMHIIAKELKSQSNRMYSDFAQRHLSMICTKCVYCIICIRDQNYIKNESY